ncbi:MAG: nuclear transport factor 2 family protein [Deltaproteobacteria bacterium]
MTEEIKRLNDVWITAWFEKDASTVDALMTPDYEYVAPNGQILDRDTILRIIRSPTYKLMSGSRTEVKFVEIAPDVFAVSYRWQGTGAYEGRSFTDDHRGTMLCVRRKGKWLVAHEQCSPIGP